MSGAARHTRLALLCLLLVVLGWVVGLRASTPRGQALAYTTCTLNGPVRMIDVRMLAPDDTLPVRVHEDAHAEQCGTLGWANMHLRNLTAGGRLSLEAPAYCAGARARLRRGDNDKATRERMFDDANAMFAGSLDSATVNGALRAACPELTASLMQ